MTQIRGSTLIDVGLDAAAQLLINSGNSNANKTIILFSDGQPNDREKVLDVATRVKDKEEIRIIGIGQFINREEMKRIASPLCDFAVPTMKEAEGIFRQFPPPKGAPSLLLKYARTSSLVFTIEYNNPFEKFEFEKLDATNGSDYESVGFTRIKQFTVSNLKSNTQYYFRVRAKLPHGEDVYSSWSELYDFRTLKTTPDSKILASLEQAEQINENRGEIILNYKLASVY